MIRVTVVASPAPRQVIEQVLTWPEPVRIQDIWTQLQADPQWACLAEPTQWQPAVWGRKAHWQDLVQDADRLEWVRALKVDPKVARRERFRKQGARTAGLFAKRRPGAKPGY